MSKRNLFFVWTCILLLLSGSLFLLSSCGQMDRNLDLAEEGEESSQEDPLGILKDATESSEASLSSDPVSSAEESSIGPSEETSVEDQDMSSKTPLEEASQSTEENSSEQSSEEAEDTSLQSQEEASETSQEGDFTELEPYSEAYCREHYKHAAAVLDEIGWDLRAAYDWCVSFPYNEEIPIDGELGTEWYAEYGFREGEGHCYTFAALMTEFSRLLGYEARQVAGNLIGRNPFHHSWVEIVIDGKTYVLDPEVEWEMGYDCYLVEYNAPGTLPYDVDAVTVMNDEATKESLERLQAMGWSYEESQDQDPNEGCLGEEDPFN